MSSWLVSSTASKSRQNGNSVALCLGRVVIIIAVVVATTKGREEGAGVTLVTSPV